MGVDGPNRDNLSTDDSISVSPENLLVKGSRPETATGREITRYTCVPVGLKNVGNTCYANAAIQCMLATALSDALLDPSRAFIFRKFSSNLTILEQGSGSFDSEDGSREVQNESTIETALAVERMKRRALRKQKREDRQKTRTTEKSQETSVWLTTSLTDISRKYFMVNSQTNDRDPTCSLSSILSSLSSDAVVVDPGNITRHVNRLSPCLIPYRQEDAHEFLRSLLSTLTQDGQNKQLSSLFDGLLESAVTCQTCRRTSITRDRYMDLSLDIQGSNISDLSSALESFAQVETLSAANKVLCSRCHVKRTVKRAMRLATAPTVLVCHLKRFSCDSFGRIERLKKHIEFPLRLDISEIMSRENRGKPPPYELVGVLVHIGQRVDRGHYIAFVKSGRDWYKVNDSLVSKVPAEVVLRQQAYMLFYEVAGMRAKHGVTARVGDQSLSSREPGNEIRLQSPIPSDRTSPSSIFRNLFDFCCHNDIEDVRDNICFPIQGKAKVQDSDTVLSDESASTDTPTYSNKRDANGAVTTYDQQSIIDTLPDKSTKSEISVVGGIVSSEKVMRRSLSSNRLARKFIKNVDRSRSAMKQRECFISSEQS